VNPESRGEEGPYDDRKKKPRYHRSAPKAAPGYFHDAAAEHRFVAQLTRKTQDRRSHLPRDFAAILSNLLGERLEGGLISGLRLTKEKNREFAETGAEVYVRA
jgi:hypothetical protein